MNDGGTGFVLMPGEGRAIDLGNFGMSVKATGDETGGLFTLLEAAEPAGFGPPLHIHHDAAEAFYVLDGEYVIFLEEREYVCPTGSFIFIPAGLRHGFRVGRVPSRKLNLYAPAAMIGYFRRAECCHHRQRRGSRPTRRDRDAARDGGRRSRPRGLSVAARHPRPPRANSRCGCNG